MFTALDTFTLVAYLVVISGLGIFFSRQNKGFHDFMFGGGRMPWWAIGISLIATSVSATTFLGNPADTYGTNMTLLMCNFGGLVAIVLVGWWFIPRFQRLGVTSAYEVLEQRFSRPVRLLAAVFYSAHLILRTGMLLYGPSLVLSQLLNVSIYLAICVTSVLAIVYTYFGGLRAVVWTDVMQFFVLFGGGLLTLWTVASAVGGWGEMGRLAAEAGKTTWFDGSLDPSNARTFLSAGVAYIAFDLAIRGCDQQFVQRYMACKDIREANYSSVLSLFLGLLVGLLFYWVGAGLFVYFQSVQVQALPEGLGRNDVFPFFLLNIMPSGITGLMVAAIFAAAMSSLDSAITALSNTTVTDFLRADPARGDHLQQARIWVLVWGVLGTLAAFVCVLGEASLLTKALFFTSLFTGPLLGIFLLAFFAPKARPRAVFGGAIIGMLCLLPFSKIPVLPDHLWEPIYTFSWPWNPLISMTGTLVGAALLHFLWPRTKAVHA
ncbi:Sodium/solute symporter [Sulfidibacter corallicola]|uniref:Sodium/solute symporter n=1 Tax=Sulfidibacter corallicola TaxID=2818388 RepID=A0A8A4TLW0_SULCO|nr:sodium/solute symporter [Sulfidibacter corallicola]QTD50553.1 sodium/solute symporter [Sulfidibacter corallicola]